METYNDIYLRVRKTLKNSGVETSEFEARLIVSHCAGRSREELLVMSKIYATDVKIRKRIDESLDRRLSGEPLAYVLGEWEFYGVPLTVNQNVLIPRVDTEVLARETIGLLKRKVWQTRLLDLCTGSGCIGLAVAANVPGCKIVMIDSSEKALSICRENIRKNGFNRNITVIDADVLMKPPAILGEFDVIVSNPPYIPSNEIKNLDDSVKDYEPVEALDGGDDGLDYFHAIAENWRKLLKPGGHLAVECGINQAAAVRYILKQNEFKDIRTIKDTLGIERVVIGMI
ncbi:MAG: peptide chain release factor N(5)-glutamine methyltransferase [Oscillospiraceae bacterium]|jgi:release factor glutamine methyltransferase|nr:peptide chain release factor N(5)-glutamine methyltransferase [Oscillospiraceae bacterium]